MKYPSIIRRHRDSILRFSTGEAPSTRSVPQEGRGFANEFNV